jgi:hypothetical protein
MDRAASILSPPFERLGEPVPEFYLEALGPGAICLAFESTPEEREHRTAAALERIRAGRQLDVATRIQLEADRLATEQELAVLTRRTGT